MAASPNLLNLGNPRKVKENLESILGPEAEAIESEIGRNTKDLYKLALYHYRFAVRLTRPHWRQRVSRLYCAAFAASRAIRLQTTGQYSTEVADHKRIENLPDDFPKKAQFSNRLPVLREDRNTCDYGHDSKVENLVLSTAEATQLVADFLRITRSYLIAQGVSVEGKP